MEREWYEEAVGRLAAAGRFVAERPESFVAPCDGRMTSLRVVIDLPAEPGVPASIEASKRVDC